MPYEGPKVEKLIEVVIIMSFELALYQLYEIRTKQKGRVVSKKNLTVASVCKQTQSSILSYTLLFRTFRENKKEKNRIIF